MSQLTTVGDFRFTTFGASRRSWVRIGLLFALAYFAGELDRSYGQSTARSQNEVADSTTSMPSLRPRLVLPSRDDLNLSLVAKLDPNTAFENSGLVKSRRHAKVFWFLNDSGNEPRIYPINRLGKGFVNKSTGTNSGVLIQDVVNRDWEDIAVDDAGNLIIADVGNNGNERRDLTLYFVREPSAVGDSATVDHRVVVKYPDQREFPAPKDDFNFDCEAVFALDNDVYLLTKHRSDVLTKLYRLPDAKKSTDAVLQLVDRFDSHGGVTAADGTADGLKLVVTTYQSLWLFERETKAESFFDGNIWWAPYVSKQVEAVCFDGPKRILLADEQLGELYSVALSELTKVQDQGLPVD